MADKISKFFNLDDFLNQQIPDEIAEKLRVAGRIEQILKPTSTSAVSTSAQDDLPDSEVDEVNREIDDLIDHVASMEDLVEQLEDMVDDHLKDMAIPPANDTVADAANSLGGENGVIDKNVIDQANLLSDLEPMMLTGTDPIAAALTGAGVVDPDSGDFLNCNEMTRALAKKLRFLENPNIGNPEIPLNDLNQDIAEAHEQSLGRMILDIIMKLIWNIIWVKLIVDHAIINPLRLIIANPLDNIILFFKRKCGRFKRPSASCREKNGPINKLLNKLRIVLICKVPPKFYKRYDPMENGVRCPASEPVCPPQTESSAERDLGGKGSLKKMEQVMDELGFSDCVNSDMLSMGERIDIKGPGLPPECYKKKGVVLQAALDASLNPSEGARKDSVGAASNSSVITGATDII